MSAAPDITLRDLLRWDRRLSCLPPASEALDATLERAVSWAVAVRATPPLLPTVRGDELVVLPSRVLAQIEADEPASRAELLATLARRRVAALLTDPDFTEEPLDGLPVLVLPSPFPHDAESMFNRLITERRAELYRLGNELSRRLSQAAVDPRGVEALLATAAEVGGRPLVLQDADGNVVAWGGGDLVDPGDLPDLVEARQAGGPHLVAGDGVERLVVALAAGGRAGYLSTVGPPGSLNESDRLILSQTAGTCSIVLGHARGAAVGGGRQSLVADLLLGRLASDAAAIARARALGLDPSAPTVVGVIDSPRGLAVARRVLAQALGRPVADTLAALPGGAGFIAQGIEPEAAARALREALRREGDDEAVALSRPLPGPVHATEGLRQARFALALHRGGAVQDAVVCCGSVDDLGLFSLLYPLWGSATVEEFREGLIGRLEAYDRRRRTRLVPTLETYLSSGGALAEAAERLGIHRNTLSYRLARINELLGRDLSNPRDRLLLQVALLARALPPVPEANR
ncbi:MAG TPA: helix-turn-helix domain-containing protein [Thermomicrobiaceae bacterium]|nr:helix-turn-helix domain-containing protein [Thermomicrobiaceae bacterium]